MKSNDNRYTYSSLSLITVLTWLVCMTLMPASVFASEKHHEVRAEVRIKELHDKLKISQVQEEQWAKVAQTMHEDAKVMDQLTQTRADHAKDMTAIDDLKSYGEITAAHAEGIKKLTPVFAALYDTMSDSQKKDADSMFRHVDHKHKHEYKKVVEN